MGTDITQAERAMGQLMQAQSEATKIEASRAQEQVRVAATLTQIKPRDEIAAFNRMRESCRNKTLADRAFFAYSRGRENVTGATIQLAVELARCWGHVDYGIMELSRSKDSSEMMAYAWDLESNSRSSTTFIVPHLRDKRDGPQSLSSLRDVYENNANMGARRLREMIFRVLPQHYVDEAKALCFDTSNGRGENLVERREKLLEKFAEMGVTRSQIERRCGRPVDKLTHHDIAAMGVVYRTILHGESTIKEQFGSVIKDEDAEATDAAAILDAVTVEIAPESAQEPRGEEQGAPYDFDPNEDAKDL